MFAMKKQKYRRCGFCRKPFAMTNNHQAYCQTECYIKARRERACLNHAIRKSKEPPIPKRNCPVCDKSFQPEHKFQKYCEPKCARRAWPNKRWPLLAKSCAMCGTPFSTRRSDQITCGIKCSKANMRAVSAYSGLPISKCMLG